MDPSEYFVSWKKKWELTQEDATILATEGTWLNDNIIEFAFQQLREKCFGFAHADMLFVSPGALFVITYGDMDDVIDSITQLDILSKDIIFFPINDALPGSHHRGTHWELVVFFKPTRTFLVFNSLSRSDSSPSIASGRVIKKLIDALNITDEKNSNAAKYYVKCVSSPQQENSYDCGMYVICFAQAISSQVLSSKGNLECSCVNVITPEHVVNCRKYLLHFAGQLREMWLDEAA